ARLRHFSLVSRKSAMTMRSQPRLLSSHTSALPMKPAPPVTSTLALAKSIMRGNLQGRAVAVAIATPPDRLHHTPRSNRVDQQPDGYERNEHRRQRSLWPESSAGRPRRTRQRRNEQPVWSGSRNRCAKDAGLREIPRGVQTYRQPQSPRDHECGAEQQTCLQCNCERRCERRMRIGEMSGTKQQRRKRERTPASDPVLGDSEDDAAKQHLFQNSRSETEGKRRQDRRPVIEPDYRIVAQCPDDSNRRREQRSTENEAGSELLRRRSQCELRDPPPLHN